VLFDLSASQSVGRRDGVVQGDRARAWEGVGVGVRMGTMEVFLVAPIGELHTLQGPLGPRRGSQMRDTGRQRDAGLLVRGGYVAEVGPARDLIARHPGVFCLGAEKCLVTPGLIDPHTHLIWAGSRSDEFLMRSSGMTYEEIARKGGGISRTHQFVLNAREEDLVDSLLQRARFVASYGTTTVEIKASYGLTSQGCGKELDALNTARNHLGLRTIITFMGAHAVPPDHSREDFLEALKNEAIPKASEHPSQPQFNDVFCEEGAFNLNETEEILRTGMEWGLTPKVHADEFTVLGGTELACRLKAASADHLLVSGKEQIEALARSSTVAVLLPGVSFYLGKPFAPARQMIDAGCAVALGSDFNPGSSMVASLPLVMGLAVSRMGLSPEEALTAVTVNARSALQPRPDLTPRAGKCLLPPTLGMLVPGSPADFCVWEVPTLEDLAYSYSFIQPLVTFVQGAPVYTSSWFELIQSR
jgi:imidazolonepropionase